jgi:hypothetical protein
MPKKSALVVHHSLSYWGDAAVIDQWHKSNGWKGIGYHKVICNGFPAYKDWSKGVLKPAWDGKIQEGRVPETSTAAAVKEGQMNSKAIHICLIGNFDTDTPTPAQWAALVDACARLCTRHKISPDAIYYHRDWAINPATGKPYKSCPGNLFPSRATLRTEVKQRLGP